MRKFKRSFDPSNGFTDDERPLIYSYTKASVLQAGSGSWTVELDAYAGYEQPGGAGAKVVGGPRKIYLERRDLLGARIRTGIHVFLSTRAATEYALPFIVAFLPIPAWVLTRCAT